MRYLALALLLAPSSAVSAESQQPVSPYALTETSLEAATVAGESGRVFPAPLVTQRIARGELGMFGGKEGLDILAAYKRIPYQIYILSPYTRAASTAADAKRRFVGRPVLSADELNADGIVVSVIPAVENVVLKRGDAVVHPSKAVGGAFYFPLETFVVPATLVCVGPRSNYEMELTASDMVPLDIPITDEELQRRLRTAAEDQLKLDAFNVESRARQQAIIETQGWYVKDSTFAVIEVNDVFIRFSWRTVIRNSLDHARQFDLEVHFLNARDLIVDTDRLFRQTLPAFDERAYSGSALIGMPAALTVTHISIVAKPR